MYWLQIFLFFLLIELMIYYLKSYEAFFLLTIRKNHMNMKSGM